MDFEFLTAGQRISDRRKHLRIKQNVLAERIGVSNNHLSSVERGQTLPSLDSFVAICNELNVTPDYLLMGTMHQNNLPQNLIDSLLLCSEEDLAIISVLVEYMVRRNSTKWNMEHFSEL